MLPVAGAPCAVRLREPPVHDRMLLPRSWRRDGPSGRQTREDNHGGDESEDGGGGEDETQVLPDVGEGHSAYATHTSAVSFGLATTT